MVGDVSDALPPLSCLMEVVALPLNPCFLETCCVNTSNCQALSAYKYTQTLTNTHLV